jgi:hypothetical protein
MEKGRRSGDPPAPPSARREPPSSARTERPSKPPDRLGAFAVHPVNDHVTEVAFTGQLTTQMVEGCHREFWQAHHEGPPRFILVDATELTGYDPDIAASITRVIHPFRSRGGQEYLMIASSGMIRMMGWAIAVATRTPLRFFDSRRDALAYARANATPRPVGPS